MKGRGPRANFVVFADESIKAAFDKLSTGKFEDKELWGQINAAFEDLKLGPFCGIKIPKRLWPKDYVSKYRINNLWKLDLPNGWRLIYTVKGSEVEIVSIVLEWFNHKEYAKHFKYASN